MFTDKFISGGEDRPAFRYITVYADNDLAGIKEGSLLYNKITFIDYIPFASIGSGLIKIFAGLIHTIVHLVKAIFNNLNRYYHLREVILGFRCFVRGFVVLVPIIGNIAIYILDVRKLRSDLSNVARFQKGYAVLYEGGHISKIDAKAYYQKIKDTDLSPQELLHFMRGGLGSVNDHPFGGIHHKKHAFFEMKGKSKETDSRIQQIFDDGGTYINVALAIA